MAPKSKKPELPEPLDVPFGSLLADGRGSTNIEITYIYIIYIIYIYMHIYIHEVTWPDFSTLLAWIPAKPGQHSDLSKPTCWTVEPCWSYGNLPGQLRGGVPQPVWDLKSLVHFTSICVGNSGNLTGNGFLSKAFTSNMVLYCSEALRWAWCVVFGLLFFRCWKRDSCVIWLWQSVPCSVDRYPHASFYYFDIYFELFTQIEPIVNTCWGRYADTVSTALEKAG